MGGRGSAGGWQKKIGKNAVTLDEYLGKRGVAGSSSMWTIDKMRSNRQIGTQRGKDRFHKEYEKAESEYQTKRNAAISEYNAKIASGELRNKTTFERSLTVAHGHPDNPSTQAARRILEKRGYDWKTGNKLKKK